MHKLKKEIKLQKKIINSLNLFWKKYNLIEKPNFGYLPSKRKNLNNNHLTIHAFYRLNFFINLNRKEKLKLLNSLQAKKVNCNEGPCPEIYREKIFKKLKIFPKKKLTKAIELGNKSFVYHINPYIKFSKLNRDIKILKKNLIKHI